MSAEFHIRSDAPGADFAPERLDVGAPLKGLSFQNRIAVVALITAVAVLTASTGLFILQEWRTDRERLIQHQGDLAEVTASRLARPLANGDRAAAAEILGALAKSDRVTSAYVLNERGLRLAQFHRPAGSRELVKAEAPILKDGRRIGEVVVEAEAEDAAAILPRFIALGGSLFFVAAGLALFMGRWLAAKVTKPVNRLSTAMREVARSRDFAKQVERAEDDEFGRLTDSFNTLLAHLHRNDLDLRAAMDELVEARDAAEAANVLKSHFLANMSHEIRTPLNGVLAMAQIMAMGDLAPAQRERLEVISRSGEALLAILNDILDLSKIEAGRMELERTPFTVGEIAQQLISNFGPQAAKKGLAFDVAVDEAVAHPFLGDPQRVCQIVNNLVANAVKFTETGEVRVTFAPAGGEGLLISVKDTGIGIAEDKLPLLFQKFSQLDSSTTRKFGGTGLGLAICRELAHVMGGQVWAESREGEGAVFWLTLPLPAAAGAEAEPQTAAGRLPPAPAPDADPDEGADRPLRVLAAEDNQTNQLVLKSVMATFDVELTLVNDGKQAVEAWETGDYDVILMDIQMPVMDGVTATRTIRETEAREGRPRTPIVALSANAMTHQVKEYLGAGMDRHVAKPIEIAKLHAALVAVLEAPEEAAPAPADGDRTAVA